MPRPLSELDRRINIPERDLGTKLCMELFFWLLSKEQGYIESRLVVCVLAVYNYNVLDRQHLYNSV